LNEINIQKAGVVALGFADVAEKLELTAEQKAKLSSLADETHRKLAEANDKFAAGDKKQSGGSKDRKREVDQVNAERATSPVSETEGQDVRYQHHSDRSQKLQSTWPNRSTALGSARAAIDQFVDWRSSFRRISFSAAHCCCTAMGGCFYDAALPLRSRVIYQLGRINAAGRPLGNGALVAL
jgi:hypothetical protein